MKLKQSIKMAWAAVISNKLRSFLTMLGIIIGVMAVTLLISLVQGGTDSITENLEDLGGDQIIVSVTDTHRKLTYHELSELEGRAASEEFLPTSALREWPQTCSGRPRCWAAQSG